MSTSTPPEWADEVGGPSRTPRCVAQTAEPDDLFMLIFTSGTSGEPKAVQVQPRQGRDRGRDDDATIRARPQRRLLRVDAAVPFQRGAGRAGRWPSAARASMALRRKFSASQFLPDIRRYGATYANYVGKPLSYVLATPERPDDADNPLRAVYGNEGAPGDIERFAEQIRHRGHRRVRFDRGRRGDRPHPGHTARRTGAAARRDRDRRRRHR